MERRHAVNVGLCQCQRCAPIQFVNGTDVVGPQQSGDARWNDELLMSKIRQPPQSSKIQMIVVVVAEQHDIDTGKIVQPHPRGPAAPGTDEAQRAGPLRPDRIGQEMKAALLQQHAGMVDQRHP